MIKSVVTFLTKTGRTKMGSLGAIIILTVAGLGGGASLFTQNVLASPPITVCAAGPPTCDYTDVQSAVTAANPGDTIDIQSDQTITTAIAINKQLTLESTNGSTIDTSGANDVFTINAGGAGSTVTDLKFNKTDVVSQPEIISVLADNVTVSDDTFTGQFSIGQGETERGLLVGYVNNVTVTGDSFSHLRQPVYFNGASGTVSNNFVEDTKGFVVVSQATLTFSGNTWGTGPDINAVDIAVVKDSPVGADNYLANLMATSDANNDAVIEDQVPASPVMTDAFVDASAAAGGNGYPITPYQTISPALTRIVAGGRVHVANGSYSEGVNITVPGTQLIGASEAGVQVTASHATPFGQGVSVDGLDSVSISNMTFNDPTGSPISYAFQGYQDTNLSLTDLAFNGPGKTSTSHIGGVDVNSSQGVTYNDVSVSNYYKNGFSFTAQFTAGDDYSRDISMNDITSNDNGWAGIAFYTMNGSNTIGHDITGVTFGGSNTLTNNGQGLFVEGDTDAHFGALATPAYEVTGSAFGGQIGLGSTAFGGNTDDVVNYQTNGIQALSATFGGLTGDQMTAAQRATENGLIVDQLDDSALGLVQYISPAVTVNSLTTDDTTPALSGTVNDKSAGVNVTVNGHTYVANVSPTANGSGTYDWNVGVADALPVGTYDVVATATDAGGNVATDNTTNELTITAPASSGGGSGGSGSSSSASGSSAGSGSSSTPGSTGGTNTVTSGGRGGGFGPAGGFGSAIGQVLGTTTTNSNSSSNGGQKGHVKSASTTRTTAKSNKAFLGLGWWWLLVLAAVLAAIYAFYRRRRNSDEA